MKAKKTHEPPLDQVLAGVEPALRRAAKRAREIAAQTGTALVIYRNGKIEKVTFGRRKKKTAD